MASTEAPPPEPAEEDGPDQDTAPLSEGPLPPPPQPASDEIYNHDD